MKDGLKLRALDGDDLSVVSTHLQDAVVPLSEITYLPRERRFAFVASRFRWENCDAARENCSAHERVNCGVMFDCVTRVRTRNVDLKDRRQTFTVLALSGEDNGITLVLGGGGEVRLEVERIVCHLQDIGEPWPTQWKPGHPDSDGD
ncbi:MAG: DUF2948 family protein [Alphaproteobacteria bacterium]|nr:DUF2948 family protein [Alphaproteobacteria bacterium]